MRKVVFLIVLSVLVLCISSLSAQESSDEDAAEPVAGPALSLPVDTPDALPAPPRPYSPAVARKLHDTAYELAKSETAGEAEIEQALVLLKAALDLDEGALYVLPTLLEFACRDDSAVDHSELVRRMLEKYVNQPIDREISGRAVGYLLDRVNSREEREKMLEEMLMGLGRKNNLLGSDIATMLGLLMAERPDINAAKFYLAQAYKSNRYNGVAFEKLVDLSDVVLGPEYYLERLRFALREDPLSIQAALNLGRYLERLELYDEAGDMYQYAVDVFKYLHPSESLPASIYIPWAICSYNSEGSQARCLEILNLVRQNGEFNLLLEALGGKAAAKLGDGDRATEIFQNAEEQAGLLLSQGPAAPGDKPQVTAKQFAWFYCFALPNPNKAIDWANKAYASEPNSPSSASLLAYAFFMNDQTEWAKPLVEKNEPTQISELVLGQIQIAKEMKGEAQDTLRSAISRDPGSLAAEVAKTLLKEQGGEYVPAVDPDVILNMLQQAFGKSFVPAFAPPEQMISVQFNVRGNKFPYGSEFGAYVSVMNTSPDVLVVSDESLFRGNIRVDANVRGDLTMDIPKLVSIKARDNYLIDAGRSTLIPIKLVTGKLRQLLNGYPQASVDIVFTLYIDPVEDAEGQVANRLSKIEPIEVRVMRPGIELSSKYLRNRFKLISNGQQGQKIKTAELFVGLLKEQYAMSNRKPPYKFMYADWMPTMFRNALTHEAGLLRNRDDGEWVIKVYTMAEMASLMLDHELVAAVAENLNNSNWSVRMMAMYLLGRAQKGQFDKVLEWAATYDSDERVREMAVALGARAEAVPLRPAPVEPAGMKPASRK